LPLNDAPIGGAALSGAEAVVAARDGQLLAFDRTTWARRWTYRCPAGLAAAPVLAADRLYLAGIDGKLRCLPAGGQKELWAWDLNELARRNPGQIVSSPALVGGRVFVAATNGVIACI